MLPLLLHAWPLLVCTTDKPRRQTLPPATSVPPAAPPADQPVGNYWINVSTLNGFNSPAILSYDGAPDPATDPAVSATAYDKSLGCASAAGGQPGLLDLKNASLAAGASVPPPPQVSRRRPPTSVRPVRLPPGKASRWAELG